MNKYNSVNYLNFKISRDNYLKSQDGHEYPDITIAFRSGWQEPWNMSVLDFINQEIQNGKDLSQIEYKYAELRREIRDNEADQEYIEYTKHYNKFFEDEETVKKIMEIANIYAVLDGYHFPNIKFSWDKEKLQLSVKLGIEGDSFDNLPLGYKVTD